MNRTILLRVVLALAVSVALCVMPQGAFAQRGGHGGFGGFHGGGSGGFHGGTFGGFHGGGFSSFHGGGFGFRGPGFVGFRGFGHPRFGWGWGWGVNIGFGFGSYWGWGYPYYGYGYWPGWDPYAYSYPYPDPYYYQGPQYDRCDYRASDCSDDRPNGVPQDNSKPNGQTAPAKPSNTPASDNSIKQDYRTNASDDYRSTIDARSALTNDALTYKFADLKTLEAPLQMRPAVRNAVQALRAMPPDARERQLASGRYASFSPAEKELLKDLVQAQREQ
jgi:hypothetical protein